MPTMTRLPEQIGAGSEDSLALHTHLIGGRMSTSALYAAARLEIADMLKDGPRALGELARACNADEGALLRLMRVLVALGVFEEVDLRVYGLASLGQHLRGDVEGSMKAMALASGSPWMWRPWGEVLFSMRTGEAAFDHVFGTGLFPYLSEHPEECAVFDAYMAAVTRANARCVVAAYDFSGMARIVDVGGGRGVLLSEILAAHPGVDGIVLDRPQVAVEAVEQLRQAGLADRCAAVGGDFFDAVPGGGDVYLLSHVLHDWDDERCGRILGNVRARVHDGGRLLVLESLVPDEGVPLPVALMDLGMLVLSGGGYERSQEEYRSLLASAGFELARVIPTSSRQHLGILEARPV